MKKIKIRMGYDFVFTSEEVKDILIQHLNKADLEIPEDEVYTAFDVFYNMEDETEDENFDQYIVTITGKGK